jgi:hypothetical protein
MRARVRVLLVHVLTVLAVVAAGLAGGLAVPATAGPKKPAPPPPSTGASELSVADLAVPEPADGSSLTVRVPVVLDRPASGDVRLRWELVGESAGPGDLTLGSGTVTVRAGRQVADVPTTVHGDSVTEPEESARLHVSVLSGPGTLVDDDGVVTVRDAVPGFSFGGLSLTEPDVGAAPVTVPAVHVPDAGQRLSFRWSWGRGNRTDDESGTDVTPTSPTIVSITRGAPGVLVPVEVVGDTRQEFDERWDVEILDIESGVSLADPRGEIHLPNDDPGSWDTSWQPPADVRSRPGSVLHVAGSAGDYLSQGQTVTFDSGNAAFTQTPSLGDPEYDVWNWTTITARGDVSYDVSLWTEQGADRLRPGVWTDVTRFPFAPKSLAVYGENRGCNWIYGWFAIDRADYDAAGNLTDLEVRAEQRCEFPDAPPLHAWVRWDADAASQPPPAGDPADLAWHPPAGVVPATGPYLYFESEADNGLAHGETRLVTPQNATRSSFTSSEPRSFQMMFETAEYLGRYELAAVTPDGTEQFVPALYEGVSAPNQRNPLEAAVELTAFYTGCASNEATLAVDRAEYDAEGLRLVEVRFLQPCGGMLWGAARWVRPGT